MHPGLVLALYAAGVFILGGLLAPWIFWGCEHLATVHDNLRWLADKPFHRVLNRVWLVLALAGLWPLLRALGVQSWREIGWTPAPDWSRRLGQGFCTGFLSLAVVGAVTVLLDGRRFRSTIVADELLFSAMGALASAAIVALIEETFFRGGILTALRRAHSAAWSLGVSSLIYATVHFLQRSAPPLQVDWTTGLRLIPEILGGFAHWDQLIPAWINLVMAGFILGLTYQRTGTLYLSIGLHAGWVFWLKFFGVLTIKSPTADPWWWGSRKLIDGWLAFLILLTVLAATALWLRHADKDAKPDLKAGTLG